APIEKNPARDTLERSQKPAINVAGRRGFALALACCILLLLGTGWIWQNEIATGIVTIDINPSFEFSLNRRDRIIDVKALNDDAKVFLDGKNFRGWEAEDVAEVLFSALGQSHYFGGTNNVVLLSVQSKNKDLSLRIESRLISRIEKALAEINVTPKIICQELDDDTALQDDAKKYSVSVGKMKLISSLKDLYPNFSTDKMSDMSLEQLWDMLDDAEDSAESHEESDNNSAGDENSDSESEGPERETNDSIDSSSEDAVDVETENPDVVIEDDESDDSTESEPNHLSEIATASDTEHD
ncbi:MAG: hypothetical protein RR244_07645, partial [Oscillospiraceae bacterium]